MGSLHSLNTYVFNDFSAKAGLGKFAPQRLEATWQHVAKAQTAAGVQCVCPALMR